jgi:pyruvate kinase
MAAERVGREVAVLCDLPGPKLRIGPMAGGHAELHTGSKVVLTTEPMEGTAERLPVDWKGLPELVKPGDVAYLADGSIRLRVIDTGETEVLTEVEVGGFLASRQGINLPNVTTSLPAVSEEDLSMIDSGAAMGVDMVALSFVRRGEDLDPVRNHMTAMGYDLPLIAKIEKPQAAANAEEIVDAADGVMVARGDLGIELPIEEVPLVQKRILRAAGEKAKPSITATQMLMSMVTSTRPTRAEVTDVANAIFDGTDAVMLSQETAVGDHPVEAVAMMASIAETTERELPYSRWLVERGLRSSDEAAAIAYGAVGAVMGLGLSALIVPTYTGGTARLISSHRPSVPVLAICPNERIARRCKLYWGVQTTVHPEPEDTTELIAMCARAAIGAGVATYGDRVGITAGLPAGRSGGTNLFKVHTI